MSERPILFSGPMVRAILAGTKTQTRRVVKPQPPARYDSVYYDPGWWWSRSTSGEGAEQQDLLSFPDCPFGVPGDRLWVRETWARAGEVGDQIEYRSDNPDPNGARWRPSIHMPRWASRITLEVTGVRVERLQSISKEDAQAEGIATEVLRYWQGLVRLPGGGRGLVEGGADPDGPPPANFEHPEVQTISKPARETFRLGWDTINGKRAPWSSNPWVWVVEFRRVQP